MRFPSKSRLAELHKFGNFNLLGTNAVINVDSWTYDTQAVVKLHTVWVQFGKILECFRHFFGMCEVAASIGPVLEIDMTTILKEKISAKVGVRDYEKIPHHTEITDKDLMIYIISMELEEVVEQGWYEEKRKFENMETESDKITIGGQKNIKIGEMGSEGFKENISLGSVGLKQFEEM